jgi:hypothetical protein
MLGRRLHNSQGSQQEGHRFELAELIFCCSDCQIKQETFVRDDFAKALRRDQSWWGDGCRSARSHRKLTLFAVDFYNTLDELLGEEQHMPWARESPGGVNHCKFLLRITMTGDRIED